MVTRKRLKTSGAGSHDKSRLKTVEMPPSMQRDLLAGDVFESAKWRLLRTDIGRPTTEIIDSVVDDFVKKDHIPADLKDDVRIKANSYMTDFIIKYGEPPKSAREVVAHDLRGLVSEPKKLTTSQRMKQGKPIEIWKSPDGTWTWEVYRKYGKPENEGKQYARWFCKVKSPFTDGDWGDVYIKDIKDNAKKEWSE